MPDVEVPDHPETLEGLEVAVDGGQVEPRRVSVEAHRDLLGADGAPRREQRVDNHAARRRDA